MCNPAIIGAAVAVVGAVIGHEDSRRAASQQEDAMQNAQRSEDARAKAMQEDASRQTSQAPNEAARRVAAGARTSGPAGAMVDTMLTGPGGVANDLLNLGKNTLLGQ